MLSLTTLKKINLVIAFTCIFILGALVGSYQGVLQKHYQTSQITQLNKDINQSIPYVKILDIQDGQLFGTVSDKNIRLSTETDIATMDNNLNFVLEFNKILRKNLQISVPPNMNYIASIKGKKFYNIYDSYAEKIVPQNRIFFQTKQAAMNAGYIED